MCKIMLVKKITVMIDKIIFCFLWAFLSLHSVHGQSCKIKIHETPSMIVEKTKIHGSIHSGTNDACAISGANNPIIDNTIGKTQQNKCGKIDAIIPNFMALFFMFSSF